MNGKTDGRKTGRLCRTMLMAIGQVLLEKKIFKVSNIHEHGGHVGHVIKTI